jgi:hypothetical protein
MTRLSDAEKRARVVPARATDASARKEAIKRATSLVRAKAQIDFRRDVRGK